MENNDMELLSSIKGYIISRRKGIEKVTNIYELARDYENFLNTFSCKPDAEKYPFPKKGTILDEDKSVKWNREEVERLRNAYGVEMKRLNMYKSIISAEYRKRIIKLLSAENDISEKEGVIIWNHVYHNTDDINDAVEMFFELAEMYEKLLSVRRR